MKKDDQKENTRGPLTKGLETIAETVGAVAGLASRTFPATSSRNAVQMLKDDHVLVEHLFEQFEETDDNRKRADIVRSTLDELEVHATLEEEIVYPAIRALDNSKEHQDIMDAAAEEHHVVKQLMAELREMTPQDERFAAKFTVLAEGVRHHVREEESEVLPKAEESDLDLEELGRIMQERKQQLMQQTNRSESKSESKMRSGRLSATANRGVAKRKRAVSGRATAGKRRTSSRTSATPTRSRRVSASKTRGGSKGAPRSTSKARSGRGRASAGRKRTRG
jgi:hemerythrin superfamily protein